MKTLIIYAERFEEPTVFEFPEHLVDACEPKDRLDFIYRQCNHVDGTEWIANKELRSMSVGDMVWFKIDIETKYLFVCCSSGWKEIDELVKIPKSWPEKVA